jgi:signal transduction histidine kinase
VTSVRAVRGEEALERTLFIGITAFRWAAWVWMAITLTIDVNNSSPTEPVNHPGVAYALVAVALGFTVWSTITLRQDARRLDSPVVLAVDVTISLSLLFLDPWVYGSDHAQRLGSSWAIATILSAAVLLAGRGGFAVGLLLGSARLLGMWLWEPGDWQGDDTVGGLSAMVLYSLAGATAGFFAIKLREAERAVSRARAREEVARTLHDGVLQTLAVIQRRSDDPELVTLAETQETELRQFLFGIDRPPGDLATRLRDAAARAQQAHGLRADVVLVGELPRLPDDTVDALTGAVTEAITNAAKHSEATRVTVYVEPGDDDGLFCSVMDDGGGFDPASTAEGVGLSRSIRGRITEVGGTVEVDARPGRGTELRFRLP